MRLTKKYLTSIVTSEHTALVLGVLLTVGLWLMDVSTYGVVAAAYATAALFVLICNARTSYEHSESAKLDQDFARLIVIEESDEMQHSVIVMDVAA